MARNLHLKIRKKSQTGWLMWLLIIALFTFGTLFDFLHFPNLLKYSLDAAWMLLLGYMLLLRNPVKVQSIRPLILWILAFFLYSLIVYVFRYQSVLFYLWGLRNNFRFYVAMIAFAVFMDSADGERYLQLFDKLFWVEILVCLFQYFVLGIRGDFLGGLFGVISGTNGYINIFFLIITARSILRYLNKMESTGACLMKCGAMLLVATLAELKFFFVEFCAIVVLAVMITDFSWRKLLITLASLAGVSMAITLLGVIYPFFKEFLSLEGLWEIATSEQGYTFRGDLNRLTVISGINKRFFEGLSDQLFGYGLGNCDFASFDFLCTPFYKNHGWVHYHWFSTSFIYLEMGWVGLVFFFGFFILNYRKIEKLQKEGKTNLIHCQLARIMSLCCILVAIYNSSLRMEAGYMLYFVLALPYMKKQNKQEALEDTV